MDEEKLSKTKIIKELVDHINDEGTNDNSAIQALRLLRKHDKAKALEIAMDMRKKGKRFVAVRELLLQMIDDDDFEVDIVPAGDILNDL